MSLDEVVRAQAQALAAIGPVVLRQQKKLLRRWESMSIDEAIEDSVAEFGRAFTTSEPRQFMNAFLARKHATRAKT